MITGLEITGFKRFFALRAKESAAVSPRVPTRCRPLAGT